MRRDYRLLFGPLAATILFIGVVWLPKMVPGYSQIQQTISEIGEIGTAARIPFAILLCTVAACILVFAFALREESIRAGHSPLVAYFTGCMAVSVAGAGVFAYPHPLHSYFGLSQLIGYQAPLVLAVTWRRDPQGRSPVKLSWVMFVLMWVAIAPNLGTLDRHGALWTYERPFYGLVQKSLFVVWYGWGAAIGVLLFNRGPAVHARQVHEPPSETDPVP
jgi:hypothetical membrane protein